MKRADLEKQLGKKIAGRMQHEPHADRYGAASGGVGDRREQREREKAAGLVPFAVKLPQDLVTKLQGLAAQRSTTLNDLARDLLAAAVQESPAQKADAADVGTPQAKAAATRADEPAGPDTRAPDSRPATANKPAQRRRS